MIRRQVVMPVSPERLWDALTDPEEMSGWFGARVEWDLEAGGAARFHGDDGRDRVGLIEAVRPGRHLRFRWWPAEGEKAGVRSEAGEAGGADAAGEGADAAGEGAGGAGEAASGGGESEVSYLLEPVEEGTRLTIQERQVGVGVGVVGSGAPRACAAGSPADAGSSAAWTTWDGRLLGAWAGLLAPVREGVTT